MPTKLSFCRKTRLNVFQQTAQLLSFPIQKSTFHNDQTLKYFNARVWSHILMTSNKTSVDNYMFQVNNRNTRTMYEICSKLTIKTPERRHWRHLGVFVVNIEEVNSGWALIIELSHPQTRHSRVKICYFYYCHYYQQ